MIVYTHRDLSPEDFVVFEAEYAAAFADVFDPTYESQEEDCIMTDIALTDEPIVMPDAEPNQQAPNTPPAGAPSWHATIPAKMYFDNNYGVNIFLDREYAADGTLTIDVEIASYNHAITGQPFNPKPTKAVLRNEAEWKIFENQIRYEAWYWIHLAGTLQGRVNQIKLNPHLVNWTCNRMKPDVIGAGQDHLVRSNISAHPHGMD